MLCVFLFVTCIGLAALALQCYNQLEQLEDQDSELKDARRAQEDWRHSAMRLRHFLDVKGLLKQYDKDLEDKKMVRHASSVETGLPWLVPVNDNAIPMPPPTPLKELPSPATPEPDPEALIAALRSRAEERKAAG